MKKTIRRYALPILTGILIGTSYIPFPPWALFFCLVPLWLYWNNENSLKKIFIAGWLSQFFLNLIGFHWVAYTVVEFGRMPWPVGILVLLLFCSIAHLYYPIAGVLWKLLVTKFKLSQRTAIFLLPLVLILCERLYPFLFYWHLGYPWLWARLPGMQLTEWIGFFGLNLITLFINALFLLFWVNRKPKQWLTPYSKAALAVIIATNLLGFIQGRLIPEPDKNLKVLLVQGNIGNAQKVQAEKGSRYQFSIVDTFVRLTREGIEKYPETELIMWPETAFPETIYDSRMGYLYRRVSKLSEELGVPIFTGAYQRKGANNQIYNGSVLIDGHKTLGDYQKTILLAFGEYFPFSNVFPQLKTMFPQVADFGRGAGPKVIEHQKAKLGVQICYEGLDDEFSTSLQKKGAQIFINITNDSWYPDAFEPYQHMYMTLARAVENRRPLVRVTNTGISTAILHDGEVLEFSPRNQEWYKTFDIPYHSQPPRTFYVNLSENWPWILILLIGLLIMGDKIARTGKH